MTGYTPRTPIRDDRPYLHMLKDMEEQMDAFKKAWKKPANYIVVNADDFEQLALEFSEANKLPAGKTPGKLQIQGARIIRTGDIPKGFFDVLGN